MRLIAIGFNTSGTGLTRVMHAIMSRLAFRHEIHYLGIGYSGETIRDRGLTVYPTNLKGGDVFAAFQAKALIEEIEPELVLILHDIWMFEYYLDILEPYRSRIKTVCYIPLDGNITNEVDAAALSKANSVVVYTDFARQQFENAFNRLRDKQGVREFPQVEVIPHGVDRESFHPFPELVASDFGSEGRAVAKKQVFPSLEAIADSFVVLNASRPDKRKRIDLTIEGFARFAAGKPDYVKLCLHHAIMGKPESEQVNSLIRRFDLGSRVYLNPLGDGVATDQNLNLLYNACDVGITTSMGEGWGLVSFEHGATGAAQIVPDHSACGELWRESGELVPVVRRYRPEFSVLEMGEVSVEGVAAALERLYRDPSHRQELARCGYDAAQNPQYSWDSIAIEFEDLFRNLAS